MKSLPRDGNGGVLRGLRILGTNLAHWVWEWQTIIPVSELNYVVARQKKLFKLGKDVAWSFGFEIGEDLIKQKLKEKGRWIE